jgi:dihydrofolate reductase
MRRVIVFEHLTLDGVRQAPGRADEDRRDGFEHGGSKSSLLAGEAARAVAALKEQPGSDLVVLGSGELVQTLMRQGLVDEYVLLIHPLVLGSRRRPFADTGARAPMRLVEANASPSGVVIATYRSGAEDR